MNKKDCAELLRIVRALDDMGRQFQTDAVVCMSNHTRVSCGKLIRDITRGAVERHAVPFPKWQNPKDAA